MKRVNRFQRLQSLERSRSALSAEDIEVELARTDGPAESEARRDPWRSAVWDYDPLPTARSVSAPVLILHGDRDRRISADQADSLAAAFRAGGNRDVTVRTFPDLNHFFLPDAAVRPRRDRGRLPPEVLGAIADWVVDRVPGAD